MLEASALALESDIVSDVDVEQTPVISHRYQPLPQEVMLLDVAVPDPIAVSVPFAPVERLNHCRRPFVSEPSASVTLTHVAVDVLR